MACHAYPHKPVMLEEALALLRVRPDGTYLDLTVGAGGHSEAIAAQLDTGRLIAMDRDAQALALARERLERYPQVFMRHANYSALASVLADQGIESVDGVLLDAGVSSMQLDNGERGFSFQVDGPLDMRMDVRETTNAALWLTQTSQADIAWALRTYGDIGPAGRIARAIVEHRTTKPFERTSDLVAVVTAALDFVRSTPVEVRTVFQAVRMAVNEELQHLEQGLTQAAQALAPAGRLVVITFHSGEDRVAKQLFRQWSRPRVELLPDGRVERRHAPRMQLLTRRPMSPSEREMQENPRANSARMRAIACIAGMSGD